MNRFIDVKPSQCIGCRTCEIACALAHAEPGATLDAANSPLDGGDDVLACLGQAPRLKVIKGDNVCMPVTCHHCDDAPCAAACPVGCISHVQDTVQVDQSKCIGCKSCMIACPYGMMDVIAAPLTREFAGLRLSLGAKAQAHKCDLCVDRAQGPACVSACPTHALWVANETDIRALMQERREEAMRAAVAAEGSQKDTAA
ncbi:electron transport protein HydN [Rhodoblastus acidophilus]|uniref:4Fe-4S dicluster domain-containing protein n=1 Tax=Rhodoblastus acidophilus TaxID=1074 RepID=UPI0022259931|nr:4Fe-4S dicluster domain-containing protein [Rhodoblastus acidophilus]MCW2285414.1 electron transport protein HydN [Rhodoblastus acidophilus]MCW2334337.1 electron transport protein HydN [Rhodoblastus acidophilus]